MIYLAIIALKENKTQFGSLRGYGENEMKNSKRNVLQMSTNTTLHK